MKWYHWILFVSVIFVSGCWLDSVVGIDSDGEPTEGTSPLQIVSSLAKSAGLGGLGGVITGLGWLWSHVRGRRYKKVAITGIQTFDQIRKALADKKLTDAELMLIAKSLQYNNGVKDATKGLLSLARKE